MDNNHTVVFEDARIVFRNFAGKEGQYNREGDRNFSVLLDDDIADQLSQDGWNVKWLKAREDGETEQAYLQVAVGYKIKPPRIVLIGSKSRTEIGENEVEMLDWVDIRSVDLIVRPYHWIVREGTPQEARGIKAYLKSMFITMEEDPLELKYAEELSELPARGGRFDE